MLQNIDAQCSNDLCPFLGDQRWQEHIRDFVAVRISPYHAYKLLGAKHIMGNKKPWVSPDQKSTTNQLRER